MGEREREEQGGEDEGKRVGKWDKYIEVHDQYVLNNPSWTKESTVRLFTLKPYTQSGEKSSMFLREIYILRAMPPTRMK